MHSRCMCDCYCKIRVPITRQRDEIRTERSYTRPDVKYFLSKVDSVGSSKDVPWRFAKTLEEQLPDTDRISTDSSCSSPFLSPETLNALENAERIVKDARLQITEISVAANRNRIRRNINTYSDEPPVDDEADQLLYIRERVANKFDQADHSIEDFPRKISESPKKFVDLSAPRFQTFDKRYQEFSKPSSLFRVQRPEANDPKESGIVNLPASDKIIDDQTQVPGPVEEPGLKRINTFSIQVGPSVNIERKLVAQNLENVHVSPDPHFVPETANVGTYEFQYGRASSGRKEKIVRITEARNSGPPAVRKLEDSTESDKKDSRNISNDLKDPGRSENREGQKDSEKLGINSDRLQNDPTSRGSNRATPEAIAVGNMKIEQQKKLAEEEPRSPEKIIARVKEKNELEADRKSVKLTRAFQKGNSVVPASKGDREERRKERQKAIEQRFAAVVETYCNRRKSSKETANLKEDFYRPSIDDVDDVLVAYRKTIENVVHGAKKIDQFLSRPELEVYRTSTDKTTDSSVSVDPISPGIATPNRSHRLRRSVKAKGKGLNFRGQLGIIKENKAKAARTTAKQLEENAERKKRALKKVDDKPISRRLALNELRNSYAESNETSVNSSVRSVEKLDFKFLTEDGNSSLRRASDSTNNLSSRGTDANVASENEESASRSPVDSVASEVELKTNLQQEECGKIEMRDLHKICFDYSAFYNIVESKALTTVLAKLADPKQVTERLIARVLQDEMLKVENKIEKSSKEEGTSMAVVESVESSQGVQSGLKMQEVEKAILINLLTNDVVNDENSREANYEPEKENLQCQTTDENLNETETAKRDGNKIVEAANSLKSPSGGSEKNQMISRSEKQSSNDDESLHEISDIKSDENNIAGSVENVCVINSRTSELKENVDNVSVKNSVALKVNENGDETLTTANANEDRNTQAENVDENFSKNKNPVCESTPVLNKNFATTGEQISISSISEGVNESFGKSELGNDELKTEERNENTKGSDVLGERVNEIKRNASSSEAESNKVGGTSSEASHSEGELYMPSSSSYSLGEVRVLRRNELATDNATGCDSIAIFVTKSMLTSWNESSNSLIESIGEI